MLTDSGLRFIAHEEAFVAVAYDDGKRLSIGFGHNDPNLKVGDTITVPDALKLLREDVAEAERMVGVLIKRPFTPPLLDAWISCAYNKGSVIRNVIARANAGDMDGSLQTLMTICRDEEGKFRLGLAGRRQREAKIIVEGDYGDLSVIWYFLGNPRDPKTPRQQKPFVIT